MSTSVVYETINSLEEFGFIAGTDYIITFNVVDENGLPLDLGGATIKWVLCPYGQTDYNVLQLEGVITALGTFTVTVPSASTQTFYGKYLHQPVITSFGGMVYRVAQGILLIMPRIPLV